MKNKSRYEVGKVYQFLSFGSVVNLEITKITQKYAYLKNPKVTGNFGWRVPLNDKSAYPTVHTY